MDNMLSRDQRQMINWIAIGRFPIDLLVREIEAKAGMEQVLETLGL